MTEPVVHQLHLSASRAEAVTAIRQALPEDAIVRDEDDGIGRFASERVVMVVGRGEATLGLWRGNWRLVRRREDDPQLAVELADAPDGVTARIVQRPEDPPGWGARLMNAVGNMATVALMVVAFYLFRDREVNVPTVAAIGVGGGLLWSIVAHVWPHKRDAGLETLVHKALEPLRDPQQASPSSSNSDRSTAEAEGDTSDR